jgi:hypothetical protein
MKRLAGKTGVLRDSAGCEEVRLLNARSGMSRALDIMFVSFDEPQSF